MSNTFNATAGMAVLKIAVIQRVARNKGLSFYPTLYSHSFSMHVWESVTMRDVFRADPNPCDAKEMQNAIRDCYRVISGYLPSKERKIAELKAKLAELEKED